MALSREQGGGGAGGSEAGPGGAARSDEHPGDAGVRSGKKPVGRNGELPADSAAVPAADWYRAREQRRPGREVALGGQQAEAQESARFRSRGGQG